MELESQETLRRIEEQLSELSQNFERRISSLERKIETQSQPPRAVDRAEARRLLGVGKTKLQEMINDGVLQTCEWSKEHVPMSEIFRLTAVREPEAVSVPRIRRPSKAYDAAEEAAKVLEAQRLRKLRRP